MFLETSDYVFSETRISILVMYKFKKTTKFTICIITSFLLVGCFNDAVAQQFSTVRMDGLKIEKTYVPPKRNVSARTRAIEKAYYYEDIVLKGNFFLTLKKILEE